MKQNAAAISKIEAAAAGAGARKRLAGPDSENGCPSTVYSEGLFTGWSIVYGYRSRDYGCIA